MRSTFILEFSILLSAFFIESFSIWRWTKTTKSNRTENLQFIWRHVSWYIGKCPSDWQIQNHCFLFRFSIVKIQRAIQCECECDLPETHVCVMYIRIRRKENSLKYTHVRFAKKKKYYKIRHDLRHKHSLPLVAFAFCCQFFVRFCDDHTQFQFPSSGKLLI